MQIKLYKMKNIVLSFAVIISLGINALAQDLAPYIKVGDSNESIQNVSEQIISTLKTNSFTVLGSYSPAGKSTLKVIAFTRDDLKNTVIKVTNRGALGAVFKVGLVETNGKVAISYSNPDYILRAYLMDNYNTYKKDFQKFSSDLKTTFSELGNEFVQFGGTVEADELKEYHYKVFMPYFTDPVELAEFSSFEEGLKIITDNLKANKGDTELVYKLVYQSEKVAVFGVGLNNTEEGESHFLPIIGETNVAAMPYEIILQGKEATMLHGKYRIALHWPELTMGTFMKIMSTPGDIEDMLEALCE